MPARTRPAWGRRGAWSAPGAGGPERRGEEVLGAAVGTGDELGGVGGQRAVVQSKLEAVHAPRGRSLDVLAAEVEHRAVAGALEPSRALAERHSAAEVGAALGEGEELPAGVGEPQPALVEVGGGPRLEVGRVPEGDRPAPARPGERAQRLVGCPAQGDPEQGAAQLPAPAEQVAAVEVHIRLLQVDVQVLPGWDEAPAGAAEEFPDAGEHGGAG